MTTSDEPSAGVVVLGFGPQPMDFLSKAVKMCGKESVMDPDVARMAGANLAGGTPAALAALRKRLEAGAVQAEQLRHRGATGGAVARLAHGHRGMSSEALFTRLSGIKTRDHVRNDHPYDPADLRRCRLMLEAVPSLQEKLAEAADLSPTWAKLIGAWPELCALMDDETPDWRVASGQVARRLYERMKQLQGR